jgi:antitoxin PrlF
VDVRAKITSKGQVTIPRSVREALDLHEGDELLFRVEQSRALVAKTPDFLSLGGSVSVPAAKRGTGWDDVLRQTRRERAERRRRRRSSTPTSSFGISRATRRTWPREPRPRPQEYVRRPGFGAVSGLFGAILGSVPAVHRPVGCRPLTRASRAVDASATEPTTFWMAIGRRLRAMDRLLPANEGRRVPVVHSDIPVGCPGLPRIFRMNSERGPAHLLAPRPS